MFSCAAAGGELGEALACLAAATRGLLVLGELPGPGDAAAALRIARALGWPVAADVLSGAPRRSWRRAWCAGGMSEAG